MLRIKSNWVRQLAWGGHESESVTCLSGMDLAVTIVAVGAPCFVALLFISVPSLSLICACSGVLLESMVSVMTVVAMVFRPFHFSESLGMSFLKSLQSFTMQTAGTTFRDRHPHRLISTPSVP